MEDGGDHPEHINSPRLEASLGRWATARRRADLVLIRTLATLAACIGAAFVLGGFKPTIWFWVPTAIAAMVVAVAIIRLVLQLLFSREVLRDPWGG